jgi:Uma2 family endonuclease
MAIGAVTAVQPSITTGEFLAIPDDNVHRELILGELKEYPMTTRRPAHARIEAAFSRLVGNWICAQPLPWGEVFSGEVRCRLRTDPDTVVGIDVAYIGPELAAATPQDAPFIDGPPVLVVEVLSPSDQHEDVAAKVREYLAAGVKLVWIVDPDFRTVTVHQPNREPELRNRHQQLSGEPWMSGFTVDVAEVLD